MKAVISSTYDNRYLYFLPIVVWCWRKLNVGTIIFLPNPVHTTGNDTAKGDLALKYIDIIEDILPLQERRIIKLFDAPKHKEATYAQCSRLYGASLDLPEDEVLIIGDVDMINFVVPPYDENSMFTIFGNDLVPKEQVPMCYISAKVKDWRKVFELKGKTYQQKLDELLGQIECDHFKGNYWGKDQETAYYNIYFHPDNRIQCIPRTNGQNQFATKRYDRDDSYILDRLNPDTIDFHMNRPGYEDKNFEIILTILKYHFPNEDFNWLIEYTKKYKQLL